MTTDTLNILNEYICGVVRCSQCTNRALILNAALVWAFDLYHLLSLLSDIHVENDKINMLTVTELLSSLTVPSKSLVEFVKLKCWKWWPACTDERYSIAYPTVWYILSFISVLFSGLSLALNKEGLWLTRQTLSLSELKGERMPSRLDTHLL